VDLVVRPIACVGTCLDVAYQNGEELVTTVQISVMVVISARTYNALRWRVQDVTQTNTTNEAHGAAEGPQRETTRSVSGLGEVGVPQRRSAAPALHGRNTGSSAHLKQRAFVPFQGRILAEYYGGSTRGTLFHHPDELGSLSTAIDYATSHFAERLFYPFGDFWQGSDFYSLNPHQTFAQLPDYDNDSNSDLYNTLNRHYTPMGRWLSPDPGGLKVVRFDDPQTWNMYAYVRNNPTTLTDPTGLIGYGLWWYLKRAARLLEPPLPPPPPSLVQPPPKPPTFVVYKAHTVSDPRVTKALSEISAHFASSTVVVTSGDRDTDPAATSPHRLHKAADFHVVGRSDSQVDRDLKDSSSPLSSGGFRLLQHGPYTETQGAHLHLDTKIPVDRPTDFMHEGMTPSQSGVYTHDQD
jgi:RHS repeat-associated protein